MNRIYSIIAVCLLVLLAVTPSGMAQDCPETGSGAGGVDEFRGACLDGPHDSPAVELIGIDHDIVLNLLTYSYEVYKFPPGPEDPDRPDLSHWVLGMDLEQFQRCLAADKTLSDLFVGCSVDLLAEGMDCGLSMPDPTTQLDGMRFENVIGDGESEIFAITLDETALALGFAILEGRVVAATKGGAQDIQREERPTPGYACVAGPVCEGEPPLFVCPRSQGYWKNHLEAWPITSVTLGNESYTQQEARAIMRTPTWGNASIILARQLIAAKLNIENGSNPDAAAETIEAADDLLGRCAGRLPYAVRTRTEAGKEMLEHARVLDAYNNGWLTPNCVH
jgi:hypothetical protein